MCRAGKRVYGIWNKYLAGNFHLRHSHRVQACGRLNLNMRFGADAISVFTSERSHAPGAAVRSLYRVLHACTLLLAGVLLADRLLVGGWGAGRVLHQPLLSVPVSLTAVLYLDWIGII